MKNKVCIGDLIEERLSKTGMSKAEFARRIDCSRGVVYNIINSRTLDIGLLIKISNVLETDFIELYKNECIE